MKKDEVKIGSVYTCLVSGKLVPVKLLRLHYRSGWIGRNLATNREIHIKSAQRLRREITDTQ